MLKELNCMKYNNYLSKKGKVFLKIWCLILIPMVISVFLVNTDINEQILKMNKTNDIHLRLDQTSYYDNTRQFEKSIEEYNKILNEISYEEFPSEYATTQKNLGNAYTNLALDQSNQTYLEKGIDAYKESLKIYTIDSNPTQYADIQNNLGIAYHNLSKFQDNDKDRAYYNGLSNIAFREALKIYTIDKYPIQYSDILNNLELVYNNTYTVRKGETVIFGGGGISVT